MLMYLSFEIQTTSKLSSPNPIGPTGAEWLPTSNSGRIVILVFWISLLMLHSFWQADITANLTKEVVELPVKNLDELAISSIVQPLLIRGTAQYSMFQVCMKLFS